MPKRTIVCHEKEGSAMTKPGAPRLCCTVCSVPSAHVRRARNNRANLTVCPSCQARLLARPARLAWQGRAC
jgi:hypothetical protein